MNDHAVPDIPLLDIIASAYDQGLNDGCDYALGRPHGTFTTWLANQVHGGILKVEVT